VCPERAVDVVVFAVDVAGDRAPQGDESRSWRNWQEIALRYDELEELVERYARTCADFAPLLVEIEDRAQAPAVND
jgi:hypothetical protein